MEKLKIRVSNIHCDKCEVTISKSLSGFGIKNRIEENDEISPLSYSIANNVITVYGHDLLHKKIVKDIAKSGFKVLSWDLVKEGEDAFALEESGELQEDLEEGVDSHVIFSNLFNFWSEYQKSRQRKNHFKNCLKCQEEEKSRSKASDDKPSSSSFADSDSTVNQIVIGGKDEKEYRVVLTVEGMTCASCVKAVEEQIANVLQENGIKQDSSSGDLSVNLLLHSAVVILPNKQLINKIVDSVEEAGFECRLIEALPVERTINSKVTVVLGGITCAACAVAIQTAVNDLPFILDCGINVVSKTGTFVMEGGKENLKKLQDTVEDIGYDFELISDELINYTSSKKKSRTINVSVEGMFCGHCPELITDYLSSFGEAIVIEDPITLKHPFIKFTYLPNPENNITVRRFLHDINHLNASTENGYTISENVGSFKATLVEVVSMDEHLRKLSKREVMKIVRRLIIAIVFVIPTFIFGIVAMSLLPKKHKFRMWVEEPLWVGNVSRNTWVLLILSTPVYLFAADIFHVKAYKEIKLLWFYKNSWTKRFFKFGSMNLLMCLGTTVAYFASIALLILSSKQTPGAMHGDTTTYFDLVVFLTFFLLIGRLLESYSKSRTADAISNLSKLKVNLAHLLDNALANGEETVDVKFLEIGDVIKIVPGDSPPVDCTIVEGAAEFDESALTGESKPVKHVRGHQIFSGTVNVGNEAVTARITGLQGDSLIDQIVNTVRDGQLRKAPIARTADTLTSFFVPIIVILAVITWVIWLSLGYSGRLPDSYLDIEIGGWAVWSLQFSIAVFVIACPCGIGLAAPTAMFVGSGLAAKYGILAKGGGVAFQDGANTNVICFDKTGTLTKGELKVTDYSYFNKSLKLVSLQATRDLESISKHPIARAIKEFLNADFGFSNLNATPEKNKIPQVELIAGKGLRGDFVIDFSDIGWEHFKNNSEAILGNEKLMEDYGVEFTQDNTDLITKWKLESKSIVLVAIKSESFFSDDKFHLTFGLGCRDQIRPEAKTVLSYLQKKKIECWMITGDNRLTAEAIGKEIEIPPERIISEVLPDEKQLQIQIIQKKDPRHVVAMVGDGINDAPALAAANVGIALSSGADLAVTSSDFIILDNPNPLVTLVTLFDLSRAVFRRVKFNFGWSLVYNLIGIPIAAGVIYPYKNSRLSPVWASAAMALSSISVVTSSLALRLYRPKIKAITELTVEDIEPKEAE